MSARRTDRRLARLVRIAALLAAFAPAGRAHAAPVGESDARAAVARGFGAYRSALARGDGDAAAAAVTANSLAYYDRMRRMALLAPREALDALEGTERMLVLGMRHRAPLDVLVSATPSELLAHAVRAGIVSDTSIARIELGEVSIAGERARAFVVVNGEPGRSVLQFIREDGRWKFDLEFAMRASAGLIAALSRQTGVAEDELILRLLSQGSQAPVGPEIWIPPRPE